MGHSFSVEVGRAPSMQSLGRLVIEEVLQRIGVSSIGLIPYYQGANPETETVGYSSEHPVDRLRNLTMQAIPANERELFRIADLLRFPQPTVDVVEAVGATKLRRTATYQEYWKPLSVERQLLAVMTWRDEGGKALPLGFLTVARTAKERSFKTEHLVALEEIRVVVAPAMERMARKRQGWMGLDPVILALHAGLANPCGVFDEEGYAIWLNAAAEQLFGIRETRVGFRLLRVERQALAPWRDAVLEASGAEGDPYRHGSLCVRRVEGFGRPPVFMVMDNASCIPGTLSRREREVAELAGRGYSALNIALALGIAEDTARTHLKHVYRKMGVASRAELCRALWGR